MVFTANEILVFVNCQLVVSCDLEFTLKVNHHKEITNFRTAQCTTSWQLTKTKISFAVKTIDLWSNLKVYAGIKKKKSLKKIFLSWRKKFSDL